MSKPDADEKCFRLLPPLRHWVARVRPHRWIHTCLTVEVLPLESTKFAGHPEPPGIFRCLTPEDAKALVYVLCGPLARQVKTGANSKKERRAE